MSGAEPNAALRVGLMVRQETQTGQIMDLTHAFLLGMMVAWTPSLIVLAARRMTKQSCLGFICDVIALPSLLWRVLSPRYTFDSGH